MAKEFAYPDYYSNPAQHAMHMARGMESHPRYEEFIFFWNKVLNSSESFATIKRVNELSKFAPYINTQYNALRSDIDLDVEVNDHYKSVFEFDVSEAFGAWFVDFFFKNEVVPTRDEGEAWIRSLIHLFVNKDQENTNG